MRDNFVSCEVHGERISAPIEMYFFSLLAIGPMIEDRVGHFETGFDAAKLGVTKREMARKDEVILEAAPRPRRP
jgi:hypothetical protein